MIIDLKNATIKFIGGGSSEEITVTIGEGSLSFTEHMEIEYKLDRGKLDDIRKADEQPVDVSIDFKWEWLTAWTGDPVTPADVLRGKAGWTSVDSDDCNPIPCIDIEVTFEVTCGTTVKTETVTLPDFRPDQLDFNPADGQISCSGKCNVTQVVVSHN